MKQFGCEAALHNRKFSDKRKAAMERKTVMTSTPWEPLVGYARAVRIGPHVYVSGTTATDADGRVVGDGDAYAQTIQILRNLEAALEQAGAALDHVVRTRMFVTDITQWEAVGRAHGEVFGTIRPAATMVEVTRLIDPALLVEIEAEAFVPPADAHAAQEQEDVYITYLDMHAPPEAVPLPVPEGVDIRRAYRPTVAFYRFLYDTVGAPWQWTDRRKLDDAALGALIQHEDVAIHVLYVDGTPAGYAELDYRHRPDVELTYFGLMPGFTGRGLGRFFLDWTIREAWRHTPERLWVHTCTLDHPAALSLYEKMGFVPYKREKAP